MLWIVIDIYSATDEITLHQLNFSSCYELFYNRIWGQWYMALLHLQRRSTTLGLRWYICQEIIEDLLRQSHGGTVHARMDEYGTGFIRFSD